MVTLSIVYFSGYGHTKKQAEAVQTGAQQADIKVNLIAIDKDGNVTDDVWETLANSQGIIFGSPTYMGGPPWQFKKFADNSSKPWSSQAWRDKISAGFTNSGNMNGDKFNTISYFNVLAMQHGMIWVGTGLKGAGMKSSTRDDINWLAGYGGALAQSPTDTSPEEAPCKGDLETAKLFGKRVADCTLKMFK